MDDHDHIESIAKDLNLKNINKQNFVYIDETRMEENENNMPNNLKKNENISFSEVLKSFNVPSIVNESTQTKMKNTIKNFVKNKEKSKVEIKFDDTETKVLERTLNYNNLSKEISKYQRKVKINREADVVDFTANNPTLSFTGKSLLSNSTDLNDLEKSVKEILTKNRYDTEDKIVEEENKRLLSINPEELKKRYEELKKVKSLLFQQEMKNKRLSKIKSKLYHKIKKKQKDREESLLLQQLQEVDPDGVKFYLEKKKLARAQERVELKHSVNSKFNKTIKRYHLQNNENVKEAIKENLKLRDELLKKINDEENSDEINNNSEDVNNSEEEIDSIKDGEISNEEEVDENKLLINFDEDKPKTQVKETQNGVWGMKFMKNSNDLKNKLNDVLNEIGDDSELDISDEDSEQNITRKKKKNKQKENLHFVNDDKQKDVITARKKNILPIDHQENNLDFSRKNANATNKSKVKAVTSEILEELNEDAKAQNEEMKVDLNVDDLKKLVQIEQMNEDEELFGKFLIENDTNKKEFLERIKGSKSAENSKVDMGWGSWTGDSKVLNAKEFLKKKRQIEYEKRKSNSSDTNSNSNIKVNNAFDKKFSNYLVKELPNNIHSQEEYEKLNKTTIGREWNSLTMYKKLIQPTVVKKIGHIIEPMKINDNTNAKKLCEIIEKINKKKQRTKSKM